MSTSIREPEQFAFRAEITQLLHLLAHSLYQSREIALRELISNASDALDKMRYVALTEEGYRDQAEGLGIRLEGRDDTRDLVVRDNGVGMTREELVENLGTIARSGSLEFLKNLGESKADLSLIGQFGVGFYSAFMLADHVTVRTRSYREGQGHEWRSDGTGQFEIRAIDKEDRGTEVILHLKDDLRDLTKDYRIKGVVRTYSRFIPHPIRVGDEVVNDVRPIWVEPKGQVGDEQHAQFYQHLAHRADEAPLWHLHLAVDSPIQFRAVLYCPRTNVERLGFGRSEHGLNLLARRVLVRDDCRDLLPEYLRFLYGLVDSEDLPLNVSRETLQDNTVIRRIRGALTKSVFDRLEKLSADDAEAFRTFYDQFGPILKEGVVSEAEHRDRIAPLLRFASSRDESGKETTSLKEYASRCQEGQKAIYYLGGPDLASVRKCPNLEIFRRRGIEVLYLTDPIDEFVMASLGTFGGKELRSIDSGDLELPGPEIETPSAEAGGSGFSRVLELFRAALGDRVAEVRESKRLTDSPCCLVNASGGLSTQMQRILRQANRDFPAIGRVLEVNPDAALIKRLAELSANPANDPFVSSCGVQLWSNAMAIEGTLADPEEMVARVQDLMEQAAAGKSAIIR
ncbi:molecular chaperone HtpG [Tautonia plasticadhaerens]|uniref:Chaperone protein HtpG n=1 Tax=Tautonia plasticadhaerens TaxID=2527974 RepID=A0A518H7D2_9BACT|nr:molecular chaperone HtpG [Tautonia plasticadhaerens]QDV36735.1 Chaperone protein HtpG [Tautonia plasticadhaerens]